MQVVTSLRITNNSMTAKHTHYLTTPSITIIIITITIITDQLSLTAFLEIFKEVLLFKQISFHGSNSIEFRSMCVGVFKVLKCWLGDDKGTKQAALRLHSLHHVKRGAKPVIKRKHSFHDLEHQQLISERGLRSRSKMLLSINVLRNG